MHGLDEYLLYLINTSIVSIFAHTVTTLFTSIASIFAMFRLNGSILAIITLNWSIVGHTVTIFGWIIAHINYLFLIMNDNNDEKWFWWWWR